MPKKNLDMAKFTNRQRNKAAVIEMELKKQAVPPRQAEEMAWKEAGESGGGKRRPSHSYGGRAKINSSASPKSRKTHVGRPEATASARPGRAKGAASRKER